MASPALAAAALFSTAYCYRLHASDVSSFLASSHHVLLCTMQCFVSRHEKERQVQWAATARWQPPEARSEPCLAYRTMHSAL